MDWKNIVNLEELEFGPDQKVPEAYDYETAPSAFGDTMGAKKLGWNVSLTKLFLRTSRSCVFCSSLVSIGGVSKDHGSEQLQV